jgi:hypothetical protein
MATESNRTSADSELLDETTPVSVYRMRDIFELKDTDPPPPLVTKSSHEPIAVQGRYVPTRDRCSDSQTIVGTLIADALVDMQADTLLVARRIDARRLVHFLVGVLSAMLTVMLAILLRRLVGR